MVSGGGVALIIKLTGHTGGDDIPSGTATAVVTFQSNGALVFTGNDWPPDPSDEWVIEQGGFSDGALFEVALTGTTGEVPDGGPAEDVFSALGSNIEWDISQGGAGTRSGVWTFRVREIATPSNFVEANMAVTVNVD